MDRTLNGGMIRTFDGPHPGYVDLHDEQSNRIGYHPDLVVDKEYFSKEGNGQPWGSATPKLREKVNSNDCVTLTDVAGRCKITPFPPQ